MFGFWLMAVGFRFLVSFLLLMGTNRLLGFPKATLRCALGGAVDGLSAALCLVPGLHFLGDPLWHTVLSALGAWVAFGSHISALPRGAVFVMLHTALSSILDSDPKSLLLLALAGVGVYTVSSLCLGRTAARYVPVQLSYGGRQVKLTALLDTGNTLYDPISGQSVLVVGADAAQALTGLTREQLRRPLESLGSLPGLRLIPYKTIGTDCAFMLGLRLGQVQIGSHSGSRVVAFAPQQLSSHYQALTGGVQ